jgi:hypothetical protein
MPSIFTNEQKEFARAVACAESAAFTPIRMRRGRQSRAIDPDA